MPTQENVTRFILDFSAEKQAQFDVSEASIRRDTDSIVNYLNKNDPKQYVVNGLLLCETKIKELIAKHLPDTNLETPKFINLLEPLRVSGLLDKSEIPPYKKLNHLRNRVAHQLDYQITKKDANEIWDTLTKSQRTQIEQKYNLNRKIAQETPDLLIKAMILRLHTHLVSIVEREDLRLQVQALFLKT